jgi:uncharacterized lipoprotein YajG
MRTSTLFIFIAIILISGCARPYRKINMSAIPFKEYRQENTIDYSVRQGVLYNMKKLFLCAQRAKERHEFNRVEDCK